MKKFDKNIILGIVSLLGSIVLVIWMLKDPPKPGVLPEFGNNDSGPACVYEKDIDVTSSFLRFTDSLMQLEKATSEMEDSLIKTYLMFGDSSLCLNNLIVYNEMFDYYDDGDYCFIETMMKKEQLDTGMNIIYSFYFTDKELDISNLESKISPGTKVNVKARFEDGCGRIFHNDRVYPYYQFDFYGAEIEILD